MSAARQPGDQCGAATAEVVLCTPVMLALVLVIVQFGLWMHAEHLATAAARRGVEAARVSGASAAAGQDDARAFLVAFGAQILRQPAVTATRDARSAQVHVDGYVTSVLPGLRLPVRASAAGPVEVFSPGPGQ